MPVVDRGRLACGKAEVLPVPYFHVVFTLPAALGGSSQIMAAVAES
jgi:hypothetical protein